ncbi:MAG UNVERIFIED_CONTAM: hypothetical protein LVR18_52550 [Planctomycetaceae bacterium]
MDVSPRWRRARTNDQPPLRHRRRHTSPPCRCWPAVPAACRQRSVPTHPPFLCSSQLTLPSSDLLEGQFQHHLPFAIRDWAVFCGNRAYVPSDKASDTERILQPNSPWSRHRGNVRIAELRDSARSPTGGKSKRCPRHQQIIQLTGLTPMGRVHPQSTRHSADDIPLTSPPAVHCSSNCRTTACDVMKSATWWI